MNTVMNTVRILHLEDSDLDAKLIRTELIASGMNVDVRRVADRASFAAALRERCFDLILADFNLPQFDGLVALILQKPPTPIGLIIESVPPASIQRRRPARTR